MAVGHVRSMGDDHDVAQHHQNIVKTVYYNYYYYYRCFDGYLGDVCFNATACTRRTVLIALEAKD